MTNEERIYKLCECIIDFVETMESYDEWLNRNRTLVRIKKEMKDIREEIDNN